jgi:hypothetical protein
MSDAAKDRARRWFNDEPEGFSLGIARDVLALEQRVAALEDNRQATPDSSPAADGEWRMLEVGEVIEEGDEICHVRGTYWSPVRLSIGMQVTAGDVFRFRRRVTPATPAADGDAVRAENERFRAENERLKKDNGWWRVEYNKKLATLEQRFADLRRKSDAANAECDRLLAENVALRQLRQRLAKPIDVEAFRPEFEKLLGEAFRITRDSLGRYDSVVTCPAWQAVTAFADRLNAAARKEVGE